MPTPRSILLDSPIGPLELRSDGTAITGLLMQTRRHPAPVLTGEPAGIPADDRLLRAAREQLEGYFAGTLGTFTLDLSPAGTPFQQRVWRALQEIPFGTTESYGELARRIGLPQAARAVGLANGRNPISIVIPCHRVIGADGSLTGYGGGIERKKWLLAHEQRHAGSPQQRLPGI